MTNLVYEREMQASRELLEKRRQEGDRHFDGDHHWDRAIEALAQEAVENAERRLAQASNARS